MTIPIFKVLQNEVKLCNFSARYMRCEMMKDFDEAWLKYNTTCEIAKNMLLEGEPVEKVARFTKLPQASVLALKNEMGKAGL